MNVAIIKYNAGNARSVASAIGRLGRNAVITDEPALIRAADRVILPGVGEAGTAMNYLKEHGLDVLIPELKQPVLGICLGMQLMCRYSEEGDTRCLGIFDQDVRKFNIREKVPQTGWNTISGKGDLFSGVESGYMYFVHSYYAGISRQTIGTCDYGLCFSSALNINNFYGVQFHPEKSGLAGEMILRNFLEQI